MGEGHGQEEYPFLASMDKHKDMNMIEAGAISIGKQTEDTKAKRKRQDLDV